MDKKTYKLFIKYVNGDVGEYDLDVPHLLAPNNVQPHVLVYLKDGFSHNVPFTGIMDFWFNPHEYNEVQKLVGNQPTPNCDCASCTAKKGE